MSSKVGDERVILIKRQNYRITQSGDFPGLYFTEIRTEDGREHLLYHSRGFDLSPGEMIVIECFHCDAGDARWRIVE